MLLLPLRRHIASQRQHTRGKASFFEWLFGGKRQTVGGAGAGQSSSQSYATEASIELDNDFKLHQLDSGPATSVSLNKEDAAKMYNQMQLIRRLENAAGNLYKEKIIRGFCHLYTGQEAVAVGMKAAMREQDNIITAYRCHGWSYLMNIPTVAILSELTGRKGGCQRGKGGSMHMYSPRYFGGNGIVGAQVPLGAGVALACQYRGDGGVCMAMYGDGAANQGQIFEVYNMSGLWKLPVIYVCENNHYGMGTSTRRSACSDTYYTRGDYLPGIRVNGMRVLAVRSATQFAIEHALKEGPIVLEMDTYRYMGHSMSDPGTSYRSREEVQEMRQKNDPINSFRELCIAKGLLTEEDFKGFDTKIRAEVDDATEKAKKDVEIDVSELVADVYSSNLEERIRGISGYTLTHKQINKGMNH